MKQLAIDGKYVQKELSNCGEYENLGKAVDNIMKVTICLRACM